MSDLLDHDYTDRDLLLILSERMRGVQESVASLSMTFKSELGDLRKEFRSEIQSLKDRVTEVERKQDQAAGFLAGARWLWGIILALPAGVVAYIFGAQG